MKRKTVRFDGGRSDRRLWHTYVFWARSHASKCEGAIAPSSPAIADDPTNRVPDVLSDALSTVLFSSFVLEYRLGRVLEALGVQIRPRTTLGPLVELFWKRLETVPRLDRNGFCAPPAEWKRCESTLRKLVELRNSLAHANYGKTMAGFGKKRRPGKSALKYYNAVVDAIRIINQGTGSDPQRNAKQRRSYFEPLKVRAAARS